MVGNRDASPFDEYDAMAKSTKQIEKEMQTLKQEVSALLSSLSAKREPAPAADAGLSALLKYMTDERERTNKMLQGITAKIAKLEDDLRTGYGAPSYVADRRQVPVSNLDAKVLNFIQSRDMVCADQVREAMGYRGRNAACSRLNKLYKLGVIERFQLGHKVYYKYDAGRATDILIISPPQ
ncbi:MAG: hypothetical protein M1321_00875 [Candidatus Marsarchaeota archaeon]|nr:hypothetical protein [Candidatus Marsarchaeota archaeon]